MPRDIAIFGGSFNPPGLHHRAIADALARVMDEVRIVPCGPRPDKPVTDDLDPIYRATMTDMTFRGGERIRVDLFDLEQREFTRTWELEQRYRAEGQVWHVVGADLLAGASAGRSQIQSEWRRGAELWRDSCFAVVRRPGFQLRDADLPPKHKIVEVSDPGASSRIRERVFRNEPLDDLVTPEVLRYIKRHRLYRGGRAARAGTARLNLERMLIHFDERNPEAVRVAGQLGPSHPEPELIVVIGGDGTMLRAIRQHWRLRLPFVGINTGHRGFLLNDAEPRRLLEGEVVLIQMPLLAVRTEDLEGATHDALAFNDAWVERATGQTAWLQVDINGRQRLSKLVADGALIATAAGSTGYARAMGAASLPLNTPALLLVGSNVLRPESFKPAVLPLDAEIRLTTLDPRKRPLECYIDGVSQGIVRCMSARLSRIAAAELAFDPTRDPMERLAQIQFPPPDE